VLAAVLLLIALMAEGDGLFAAAGSGLARRSRSRGEGEPALLYGCLLLASAGFLYLPLLVRAQFS
jgi:hypothetical protein